VLKAEAIGKEHGLAVRLIPVPKQVNPDCGMALEVDCGEVARARELLAGLRDRMQGVYAVEGAAFTALNETFRPGSA
jgi:hypothetical protein